VKKNFFILFGIIFLILGTIGIVIPLLPTTPFYLLSAYFFGKSSEKYYKFLMNNRVFGKYIKDYYEKKGITLKNKVNTIIFLSLGIGWSIYKTQNTHMEIFLGVIFICVSFHILKQLTLK
jgi:uncharacterized membrane protein YbaN (DUF454 family)